MRVCAPGRLHLGFLDPGGSLGRPFGSVGLVVDGFETRVRLRQAARHAVSASTPAAQAEVDRARAHLQALCDATQRDDPLHLQLDQVLPAHAGFGSGTQLALAVGRAFATWHGLELPSATLARWLGRGLRSGIGIAGFDRGGLLLDGGPGADGAPAPLLSRLALPDAWRIVVVLDPACEGLSGQQERHALARSPAMPQSVAADLCHQVLMRVLPGAATADFAAFAAGVNQMQRQLGAHFAPAQGGQPYTSAAVGRLMCWIGDAAQGDAAIGQSSWGPTGFALLAGAGSAEAIVAAAREAGAIAPGLVVQVVGGRNHGASVTDGVVDPSPA